MTENTDCSYLLWRELAKHLFLRTANKHILQHDVICENTFGATLSFKSWLELIYIARMQIMFCLLLHLAAKAIALIYNGVIFLSFLIPTSFKLDQNACGWRAIPHFEYVFILYFPLGLGLGYSTQDVRNSITHVGMCCYHGSNSKPGIDVRCVSITLSMLECV